MVGRTDRQTDKETDGQRRTEADRRTETDRDRQRRTDGRVRRTDGQTDRPTGNTGNKGNQGNIGCKRQTDRRREIHRQKARWKDNTGEEVVWCAVCCILF